MAHAKRAARGGSMGGVAFVQLTGARGAAADNSIGDAGAAAIADALNVNKTVTTIELSGVCRAAGSAARGTRRVCGRHGRRAAYGRACATAVNSIGAAGAAAIAEALKVNKTVATIALWGACLAARGGRRAADPWVVWLSCCSRARGRGGRQRDRRRGRGGCRGGA